MKIIARLSIERAWEEVGWKFFVIILLISQLKKQFKIVQKKMLNRICHLFDDKKMVVVKARGRAIYFSARQINKPKKIVVF